MKNFNPLRFAAILSFIVVLFSNCSKDALSEPKAKSGSSPVVSNDPPDELPGAIQAKIVPYPDGSAISMHVSLGDFVSEEYFPNDDGVILIENLTPGIYTVVLQVDPGDNTAAPLIGKVIENVIVTSGTITDIGTIEL